MFGRDPGGEAICDSKGCVTVKTFDTGTGRNEDGNISSGEVLTFVGLSQNLVS